MLNEYLKFTNHKLQVLQKQCFRNNILLTLTRNVHGAIYGVYACLVSTQILGSFSQNVYMFQCFFKLFSLLIGH